MLFGEEQELVRGVLAKDKKALRRFEKKYRKKLTNFVLQKVADPRDAEEIVQDTLYSGLVCLPSFLGRSSLSTWLYGIAKHEIIDFYRKQKIKTIVFSRFPALEKLASQALSPEMRLYEINLKKKAFACLGQLGEGYQKILRLRYQHGLSVAQIAKQGHESVKAIEMRLRRARFAYAEIWNHQKAVFTLRPGNISFFEEWLGAVDPSLQNPADYQA